MDMTTLCDELDAYSLPDDGDHVATYRVFWCCDADDHNGVHSIRCTSNNAGPLYPKLALDAHRRKARNGLSEMTKEDVIAYGLAVGKAIRSLKKAATSKELTPLPTTYKGRDDYEIAAYLTAKGRAATAAESRAIVREQNRRRDYAAEYALAMKQTRAARAKACF
jgi:hypothetical protein